jgi:class 3 adenylate cyclase
LSPAFVFVDEQGAVMEQGGALAHYGMETLRVGDVLEEKVDILSGLLPLQETAVTLPYIEVQPGVFADLHLFSAPGGDWVVLLDATAEERRQRLLQQKGNELQLLRDQHAKLLTRHLEGGTAEGAVSNLLLLHGSGERKAATVLFADLRGLTLYSETDVPSAVVTTFNRYVRAMVQPVIDGAGLVTKIVGERLVAIFGLLPSAVAAPEQALQAAVRMADAVRAIKKAQPSENAPALEVGIGIASGLVVFGVIGGRNYRTLSALGRCVYLADRLESQARAGEIIIDEQTFRESPGFQHRFSAVQLLLLGSEQPVPAYSCVVQDE